jgi:hypothetical protein
MKFFLYFSLLLINTVIKLLIPVVTIFIIPFRFKIRSNVYSGFLNKRKYVYRLNKTNIKNVKINFFIYYLNLILWFFLDDSLNRDIVSYDYCFKILCSDTNNKNKDLICSFTNQFVNNKNYSSFEQGIELDKYDNIEIPLRLLYSSIISEYNNNFENMFFYTPNKNNTFLIKIFNRYYGWKVIGRYSQRDVYKLVFNTK